MDGMTRMKRIRMIEKMGDNPEMSRKLGLKNRSYLKKGTAVSRGGKQP